MSVLVLPVGQPTYSELATTVAIEDESAGEFVIVSQHGAPDMGKIAITPEEWPVLRRAINKMIKECMGDENTDH